jgi:hypothetical protein
VTVHIVFDFQFTADLHTEEGRRIATAAQTRLRAGEIDNHWKDRVGRGSVGSLSTAIDRVSEAREWTVGATTADDDYDREAAVALREEVLAALRENAQEFKELKSELYDGG